MQRQLLFLAIFVASPPVLADKVIHEAYPWPNAEYPSREKPMRREFGEPLEFGEKYPKPGASAPTARAPRAAKTPTARAGTRRTPPPAAGTRRKPPERAAPAPDAAVVPPLPERADRAPWWSVRNLIRPHVPADHIRPADPPPSSFPWWAIRGVLYGLAWAAVIALWASLT
jgi:hypothetical protein